MPDYRDCTPPSPPSTDPDPLPHRSRDRGDGSDGSPPTLSDARRALDGAAGELRAVDRRLAELARRLPVPGERFSALAELRGAVDCVRADLLADAVDTLTTAASRGEPALRRAFLERRRRLVL